MSDIPILGQRKQQEGQIVVSTPINDIQIVFLGACILRNKDSMDSDMAIAKATEMLAKTFHHIKSGGLHMEIERLAGREGPQQ